ncbi:MAG: relaxase/mobilization nuclease domain-containing protein [Bacteroidetes bacterium]|nr:relaxase/mobilization nuclease domain-containing protein [Bacteroidota bacterium]
MIIKSKGRKKPEDVRQLLLYITKDSALLRCANGEPFIMRHNLRGNSIDEWEREFLKNEATRLHAKRNANIIYHEIVSFHSLDRDKISEEMLRSVASEYIRLRNLNALGLITAHGDKNHIHLHFAVSGIEYRTGKTLRVTRMEYNNMKIDLQRFQEQRFPELRFSVVEFRRPLQNASELPDPDKTKFSSEKSNIVRAFREAIADQSDLKHVETALAGHGFKIYRRNGEPQGISGKRKYRFKTLGFSRFVLDRLSRNGNSSPDRRRC